MLLVAVVLAAVAGIGAYSYLTSAQDRANKKAALVQVYVVTHDIPKGLTGQQAIDGGYIKLSKIQAAFRPATALNSLDVIRPQIALTTLAANTVLVTGQFVEANLPIFRRTTLIPKGKVAVTVQLDQVHGGAGIIIPGDKVNLVIEYKNTTLGGGTGAGGGTGNGPLQDKVLYQNVDILFIGTTAAPQPGETTAVTNPGSSLITFAVPQPAAEKIVLAAEKGAIYLNMLPPDNQVLGGVPAFSEQDVINNPDLTPGG
jgi:Flp pilus assembly protein CpaB